VHPGTPGITPPEDPAERRLPPLYLGTVAIRNELTSAVARTGSHIAITWFRPSGGAAARGACSPTRTYRRFSLWSRAGACRDCVRPRSG
jgi:hypothetical protein